MEVDLVTDEASDDENFSLDCNSEANNYSSFEGERCGICMEVVIDQGVLDCCQHWFCFTCIDNWSTITNLCPLCQNEFQLITCVPVFDTVGGNHTDDESNLSDDDWFIEGKNSALSFPSYYIDENTVLCLGEDSCKIRNGSVAIEDESDIDTSIACDSCDKWYHAFCVGFDPEASCDNSWLCPSCTNDQRPRKAGKFSIHGGDQILEASTSTGVSAPDVDAEEAAISASVVDGQQTNQESDELLVCRKDEEITWPWDSVSNGLMLEAQQISITDSESDVCQSGMRLPLPVEKWDTSLLISSDPQLGLQDSGVTANGQEDTAQPASMPILVEPADCLKIIPPDDNAEFSPETLVSHDTEVASKIGRKRKLIGSSETNDEEADITNKKFKADGNSQSVNSLEELSEAVSGDSDSFSSPREDGGFDILDIIKEPDKRSHDNSSISERETNSALRLKKIMRVAGDEKDSSLQEIRDKIREAVRNKSSNELGKNLFDPKLLAAFRAAMAGSAAENRKPIVDVKAKRSFLQKGKVRESLTKKIYGTGGKRRRAWTRDCEVEFWKHRCVNASKPERVETLQAVLDMLRATDDPNSKSAPEKEEEEEEKPSPLLGRLYLADTSVFPRKEDAVPLSTLEADEEPRKLSASVSSRSLNKDVQRHVSANSCSVKGKKPGTPRDAQKTGDTKSLLSSAALGKKACADKDKPVESDIKGDKRKWALEVLARKAVASGSTTREKEANSTILKGNFPLMAQLPDDMRPVLAACRHNKIPGSVRQVQLYRLSEHFLKKLNLSVFRRTAETELAVADAINIEKQVADKSNSKLVYLNLCSQELLRRSDDMSSNRAQEANPCSTSGWPSETIETDKCASGSEVDEALRKAGLMLDSPPSSPKSDRVGSKVASEVGILEKHDAEVPDHVLDAATLPEADTNVDSEPKLEDADLISAASKNASLQQSEPPKMEVLDLPGPDFPVAEHLNPTKIQNGDLGEDIHMVPRSSVGNDVELSHDERKEVCGTDTGPDDAKCPGTTSTPPSKNAEKNGSLEPKADCTNSNSNAETKRRTAATQDTPQSTDTSSVMKKVEAYIKEHLRPLCKSGVISVEQYRWAVGKTTEKVMKYHAKEKNANFLIREGEKVKKLAWQYVEASQHKPKNQDM